jgi:hypothetical protein
MELLLIKVTYISIGGESRRITVVCKIPKSVLKKLA